MGKWHPNSPVAVGMEAVGSQSFSAVGTPARWTRVPHLLLQALLAAQPCCPPAKMTAMLTTTRNLRTGCVSTVFAQNCGSLPCYGPDQINLLSHLKQLSLATAWPGAHSNPLFASPKSCDGGLVHKHKERRVACPCPKKPPNPPSLPIGQPLPATLPLFPFEASRDLQERQQR